MEVNKSKVGYKKPPLESRFKPGVSGNPKGRPKRKPPSLVEIVSKTLTAPIEYHDKDSVKLAAPNEIALKRLIGEALKGNIKAAKQVLEARNHAYQYGDLGALRLQVRNWLPDHPGQTAEQKTRDRAQNRDVDPLEWWKPSTVTDKPSKSKKP
jgi:hypothetical protein